MKEKSYLIVRSFKTKGGIPSGVPLNIGDIIRLGSC